MKNFKQYFTEANYMGKGAFSQFPKEQHPNRIPIDKYNEISIKVQDMVKHLGQTFVPDVAKGIQLGKTTTGDLDVIFDPKDRKNWRNDVLQIFGDKIVAKKSNGPQMMMVIKNLVDNNQYMIDFILSAEGSFDYRKKYAQFGTIIPAVLGSFARSLRYKYDQNALYGRYRDDRGNYHNIKLTNDYNTALKILMLDPKPVENNDLYTPENVAKWITDSPRFHIDIWRKPPDVGGQTINTKNGKSHRASKAKPEVKETYQLVDSTNKKATWDNTNYKIERIVLGDKFVDNIVKNINDKIVSSNNVISGNEIMNILGIPPGPELGSIIKHIKLNNMTRDDALKYIHSLSK